MLGENIMRKEFQFKFKTNEVKVAKVLMKSGRVFYMNSNRLQDFIGANKKNIFTYSFVENVEMQKEVDKLKKRASGVFEYIK